MDLTARRIGLDAFALAAWCLLAEAHAAENLLPNPGFEVDENGDGLPDGWAVKAAKGEPGQPVHLDENEKRTGERSLLFCHTSENSYSKMRTSVAVKPDTPHAISCWFKVAADAPLQRGVRSSHGAKLLVFGLDEKGSKLLGACRSVFNTRGQWERGVIRLNSRQYKRLMIMVYLHNAKGSVWVDDVELVEGDNPSEGENHPAAFPEVHLLPGTAAFRDELHLIQAEPIALTFHYLGAPALAEGLFLELEVPSGVAILSDFANNAVPTPRSIDKNGRARYALPVPTSKVRKSLGSKHGQVLILEATRVPGTAGELIWRLRRGEKRGEPRRLALTVLPRLRPLRKTPKRFEVLTFYNTALRLCPGDEAKDPLFERLYQLPMKAGLRGGVLSPVSPRRAAELLRRKNWRTGILAGWLVNPERYFTEEELARVQSVDARGKAYAGVRPCPTYCQQQNVMATVAGFYFEKDIVRRGANAGALKDGDWYVLDYEPGRGIWRECYCPRCLRAFAAQAGIEAAGLKPETVKPQWPQQWQKFRDWQKGVLIGQFNAAVKGINPKLRFGLCDHPFETWARDVVEPHIDFYCPMMYNVHPRKFFDDVETELRVKKPLLPTIETRMLGWPQWTAPREIKLKAISAAATGAKGIMIWPGVTSLDGLDLTMIRECNDALVKVEEFYGRGERAEDLFRVSPVAKGYAYWGHRAHELAGRRLLTLFNFHSRKPARFSVAVPDAAEGQYGVVDPVSGVEYLTPAKGSRVWGANDLGAGFSIEVPAYEIAFLAVSPTGPESSGRRAVRLGMPGHRSPDGAAHTVTARRAKAPVTVDGNLSDAAWRQADRASDFVSLEELADPQTVGRLTYDDKYLYVAIECTEPRMRELVSDHMERDRAVWSDDCAEVLLRVTPGAYYHLIVNPAGGVYDARGTLGGPKGEDAKWDPDTRIATSRGANSWRVEIAIPFASLGTARPNPGDVWGLNLGRTRMAGFRGKKYDKAKQSSSWFPTFGNFIPPRFGELRFAGE